MKLRTKFLLFLLALFGLYLLAGFFIAPWVVRSQVLKHLPPVLDRPVALESVRFNPLTLVLELENFGSEEPDGGAFVTFEHLLVDLQASSLVRPGFSFKEIRLTGPFLSVLREADGRLNFKDLLELKEPAGEEPAVNEETPAIPVVRIGQLVVESGTFAIEDRSPQSHYRKEMSNLSFTAENLRTDPDKVGSFNISAKSGLAETFRLSGQVSLNPVEVQGVLIMESLDLPRFMPYVEHLLDGKLEQGLLNLRLAYDLRPGGADPVMRVYDAFLELDEFLLLTHEATDPIIAWERFAVRNAEIDLLQETVEVDAVGLSGTDLLAHRHADGSVNLATAWIGTSEPGEADGGDLVEAPAPAAHESWALSVGRIEILDTDLAFLDDTLPEPARISMQVPEAELTGLTTGEGSTFQLRVKFANEAGGAGTIDGQGQLFPLGGSCTLSVDQWTLTPLDPFLSAMSGLVLNDGALDLAGQLTVRQGDTGLTGEATFDHVQLLNPDLMLVLPEKPEAEAAVSDDAVETESLPAESKEAQPLPFAVAIKTFGIVDGAFSFEDLDQDPDVVFSITQIESTIEGLSTDPSARPAFSLSALLMDITPLTATGQLNLLPSEPYADVQVDLKGLGMTPFGPYFSRYVGYNLETGLLNLDLHYTLENEELDASNVVIVNQLTLGDKTDSPDATGLPVTLAISLLKDPAGDIKVDLPIQGRLDDPKFRVGRVVMRALSTLIVKAASSPFNLLAGLVGGSAEDLDKASFAAGRSDLATDPQSQLDALAQAMEQRPGIRLEISADIDPSIETPALKRRVLKEEIIASVELEEAEELSEAEAYHARLEKAYRSRKTLAFLGGTPPVQEMEAFLLERIDIDDDDLLQLAVARKQAVRNYLVGKETIAPERVLIQADASLEKTESGLSEVHLSIK